MKKLSISLLGIYFLISPYFFLARPVKAQANRTQPLIIDHEAVISFNAGQIPSSYINLAKQNLRIAYGHTSHGSQIVTGMDMLAEESSLYQYTSTFLQDGNIPGAYDLGNPDRTAWATATRNFLNGSGSNRNVIMWSWCGQHYTDNSADINLYLSLMSQLETEFPNVIFIYMTGHLNGDGPDGITYARNNQIRDYCRSHNKVLFDFADIESHDPNGVEYSDDSDACYWCSDWCSLHSCPSCDDCAHSHCFNCYQKGKAFWWMMARLAGWNGGTTPTFPGDLNNDNTVNILDLVIVGSNFGKDYNNANTDKRADANGDRVINILDLVMVGSNFGRTS